MQAGFRAVEVTDKSIRMINKTSKEEVSVPYGMALWSTGIQMRPVIFDLMNQIGQVQAYCHIIVLNF